MNLNKKQRITILVGLLIISASLIVWLGYGGEIFTKSEVMIEKHDELLGTSYKEWAPEFVLGLDYTLAFIFLIITIVLTTLFLLKNKSHRDLNE
ncbi:MAG: hypothetical protein K9J16_17340 [Melioribacteraceae bacterium]|nr:hypothetical protein [Melioribacteraceae bacterium]MCF8356584.1 hypothetical protein [Melioribacteraceae bacterium]MCF8395977.1 hypothetical protein [Melioribacteraceae bacterium]MCF8421028.1 hypothetical protein [Melioribacteraceae bacterium]